jgi:hypothetical protein
MSDDKTGNMKDPMYATKADENKCDECPLKKAFQSIENMVDADLGSGL